MHTRFSAIILSFNGFKKGISKTKSWVSGSAFLLLDFQKIVKGNLDPLDV